MGSSTLGTGLGDVMGKMEATRQCVAFQLKLQVLKLSLWNDFATKIIVNVTINGIGARKTVLYPSITETTTKLRREEVKVRLCRNPPALKSPCLLPDRKALTLNEGDTKFQLRRRHKTTASGEKLCGILKGTEITKMIYLLCLLFWGQGQIGGTWRRIEKRCEP